MRLIGISMCEFPQSHDSGFVDTHDALSQNWGRFCAMAGLSWLPLPNRGQETLALVTHLDLAGIILTGGGDVGKQPCRDSTEQVLLTWARTTRRPLLGVCRGFQFIQCALGGHLVECNAQRHVAQNHTVKWLCDSDYRHPTPQSTVNSFHNFGIHELAPPLRPLALCEEDDTIEAAYADNIMGIMWHPERELLPRAADINFIHRYFY